MASSSQPDAKAETAALESTLLRLALADDNKLEEVDHEHTR